MDARELTRDEKKKIRSLVTGMCANYDRETGLCLPLDCACYMLHKCWTGAYCRYFREAVLPLDPELLAALTVEGGSPELRACTVCGRAFLPEGRQAYCSDACKAEGNRRKSRERMRKMREKRPGGGYDLPPRKAWVPPDRGIYDSGEFPSRNYAVISCWGFSSSPVSPINPMSV